MKSRNCLPFVAALALWLPAAAHALEKLPFADIPSAALTSETQIQFESTDNHLSMVWWIPQEFWLSVFGRDENTSPAQKKEVLDALKGYFIVGVVQADITSMGGFRFYTKEDVSKSLTVSFAEGKGASQELTPLPKIEGDMQLMLASITPILTAAMGNLGSNFHFYVFEDAKDGLRLADPYAKGALSFDLLTKGGSPLKAAMDLPLDSLYKPRLCPNGKKAHVSWKFCPWTGEALPE